MLRFQRGLLRGLAVVSLAWHLTATDARAAIIFDNGMPDQVTAAFSDFISVQQAGDFFTFATTQTIRDVHWWGVYDPNSPIPTEDDFTLRIYNVAVGVPEINPTVLNLSIANGASRTATGNQVSGAFDEYAYSVVIPDLLLGPGDYFLSIVNDTSGPNGRWAWSTSDQLGTFATRTVDGEPWSVFQRNLAFNLTNDIVGVPEPGTLALFGIGLAGLAFARRRRSVRTP